MESVGSQPPEHDKKAKQKGLHYPLSPELTARVIRYLNAFRVVIAIALLVAFAFDLMLISQARENPTLTLTAHGQVIDQLSVEIGIMGKAPYTTYLDEHAAVALVHAMSSSKAVAALARQRSVSGPLQIATPPETPERPPAVVTPPASAETASPATSASAEAGLLLPRK